MDPQFPTALDQYCKIYGVSFFDLELTCIFCKFPVCLQDLASFYMKSLSLIWREGKCYACCCKCVRLSALFEFQQHCQCGVPCTNLPDLVNKQLKDIVIRCRDCYTLLSFVEKLDCVLHEEYFYLVRGHWRGLCRYCLFKQ
uniref:Protein E6 n=1 Tax=Human papillomavirus TaxID=10566 RepID=A0A385PPM1_9PAPI|nr:MAG: E6 protein [Human papillomavirus]